MNHLDDNSVLFVIGDHGMTATGKKWAKAPCGTNVAVLGDHGGESEEEVTAAMFVYSKQPLVRIDFDTTIRQIDLVPTLSTILGVPIPYSNLGSIVLDSLPDSNYSLWQALLFSTWANTQQITDYINQYASESTTFDSDKLRAAREKFALLNARVRTVKDEYELASFVKSARDYMLFLRQMCEEVWVKFDSFSMSRGLLLTFLTIFFVYLTISGIPAQRLPEIFVSPFIPCSYGAVIISGFSTYLILSDELNLIFFVTGIVSVFMLAVLVIQNWTVIALNWYSVSKKRNLTFMVYRISLLFSVGCLFSNSYIVEEDNVSLFLTLTLLLVTVYDCDLPVTFKGKAQARKPKLFQVRLKLLLV